MNNLAKRLLTAAVAVPILVYLFYRGGLPFLILIEFVMLVGMSEYFGMVQERGFMPSPVIGTLGALALGVLAYYGRLDLMAFCITAVVTAVMLWRLKSLDLKSAIAGSAVTLFGVIYVGWLLSHAILLRFPPVTREGADLGLFFMILAIAGTFLADAGAYFTGRALGRHKLAPLVSPGKTWEGAVGGVVGGTLGVVLTKLVFDWWIFPEPGTGMALIHCLILGPILVVVSIGGDLFESMIKRDAGIKDSGWIVPGHGGIMDRLDSILLAVPATYYYLRFAVYGGWM